MTSKAEKMDILPRGTTDSKQEASNLNVKKDNAVDDVNKKSTMKFFFFWFGIPIIVAVALGWVMGHC
jgi:hypothetical protein